MLEDRLARPRVTAGGRDYPVPGGMLETAENLRREYAISRAEQDELALRSHQLAVAAQQDGTFAEEIVPVAVERARDTPDRARRAPARGHFARAARGAAPDHVPRGPARRRSRQATRVGRTTVRRSASSPTRRRRRALGLQPFARLVSWAVAGVAPATMGIGPVPSSAKALERAGLSIADMSLIELNEAFAAQALAVLREWELPDGLERVNVHGSGISLGHPIGATGGRIMTARCCASCAGVAGATASRRCASAAGRAWRPCSRTSTA